jgi:type IVB pilus formation R64 PilN family outer membrane protein
LKQHSSTSNEKSVRAPRGERRGRPRRPPNLAPKAARFGESPRNPEEEMSMNKWMAPAKKATTLAVAVSMAFAATGCASVASRNAKDEYTSAQTVGREQAQAAYKARPDSPLFSESNGFWVDKHPLPLQTDEEVAQSQLPPIFKSEMGMNVQQRTSLNEVFARAGSVTGVRFSIAPDAYEIGTGFILSQQAGQSAQRAAPVVTSGARSVGGANGSKNSAESADIQISDLVYKGTLAGMLDQIAAKTDLSWRWDGERVVFYRYATKTFRISALQGSIDSKSVVSTTSQASQQSQSSGSSSPTSGVGGQSTSTQDTTVEVASAIWAEIDKALQGQLTAHGKLALMPSAGTITVTDTPQTLRAIGSYIDELNHSLSKQVMFNVDVYNVEISDADNYGVDWNVVWQSLSNKYKFGFSTFANGTAVNTGSSSSIPGGAGAISGGVVSSANGGTSPWNGSSAVFQALSSIGRTSLVSSSSLVTINNFTVPMNVITEKAYLASVSTTVTGSSGTSQTSLTPGLVTSGIMMNLTPRMLDGDKMLLQFSLDLSNLISIDSYTSGGASIQVPTRSVRNFLQRVLMRSGQTLVLSGFQQTQSKNNTAGVGSPDFWGIGGSKATTSANTTLVIVITPYVMHN